MNNNRYIEKINKTKTPDPNDGRWSMVLEGNPVELEVMEFLHSFVRSSKPLSILETGTNIGYSTVAMSQALLDNNEGGVIDTIDIKKYDLLEKNKNLFSNDNINFIITPSLDFKPEREYDMIFLDSLRDLLYEEFIKFWDYLKDDGYLLIHDTRTQPEKREAITKIEKDFNLVSFKMKSARGIDIFHKLIDKEKIKHGKFNWET